MYKQKIAIDWAVSVPIIYAIDRPSKSVQQIMDAEDEFNLDRMDNILNAICLHVLGLIPKMRDKITWNINWGNSQKRMLIEDDDIYDFAIRNNLGTRTCPDCGSHNFREDGQCWECERIVETGQRVTAFKYALKCKSNCHEAQVVWHEKNGYTCCKCGEECDPVEKEERRFKKPKKRGDWEFYTDAEFDKYFDSMTDTERKKIFDPVTSGAIFLTKIKRRIKR